MQVIHGNQGVMLFSWCPNAEPGTLNQAHNMRKHPGALWAALIPDAHAGYGMPIGGVLGTDKMAIPNAVGVN